MVGHTQDELAKYVKVQRQSVAQWKDGKTKPDIYYLTLIADFFHVSTDYLLGREVASTHDASYICEQTGLSEDAVKWLTLYNTGPKVDYFMGNCAIRFLNALISCDESASEIGTQFILWINAVKKHDEEGLEDFTDLWHGDGSKSPHDCLSTAAIVNGERYETVRKFEHFLSLVGEEISSSFESAREKVMFETEDTPSDGNDNKDKNR